MKKYMRGLALCPSCPRFTVALIISIKHTTDDSRLWPDGTEAGYPIR